MKKIILYCLIASSLSMLFAGVSYSSNDISLPNLGSDDSVAGSNNSPASSSNKENNSTEEKTSEILLNEAQSNFQNLTAEGMKSEALQYGKNLATASAQSEIESLLSPYGHIATNLNINDQGSLEG